MVFGFKNKSADAGSLENEGEKTGLWGRLKSGLSRTREGFE